MPFDFGRMNAEQKAAVQHMEHPCRVIAGAGSGKTTVLTKRIEYLLYKGVNPKNILAITFTKKAATEMKERLISLVGLDQGQQVFLGTFHSFGFSVIRSKYRKDGKSSPQLLSETDKKQIVAKILSPSSQSKEKITSDIDEDAALAFISWQKNYLIMPNDENLDVSCLEGAEDIDETYLNDLRTLYKRYELVKNQMGVIDFDDMLVQCYTILKKDRDLRTMYQNIYKYILVDEFQDTNVAQYDIVKLLAGGYTQNVFIVGDARQAIYSWRASKVDFILNFEKDWKNARTIELNDNYRSTVEVVNMSTELIKHSTIQYPGICRSGRGNHGEDIYSLITDDDNTEAQTIAYIIDHLVNQQKLISYSDIAILYRLNMQSRPFEDAFSNMGIPYYVAGSEGFYGRREIKELLAYLHLADNPNDMDSFKFIMNVPERGITNDTYNALQRKSHEYDVSISEVAEQFADVTPDENVQEMLQDLGLTLAKLRQMNSSGKSNVAEMLSELVRTTGYIEFLKERMKGKAKGKADDEGKEQMIYSFIASCERFKDVDKLFQHIQKVEEQQADRNSAKVQLMSLHRSKGLEFDTVFMVGLIDGLLPHAKSMKVSENGMIIPESIEEERRLCYVGITRAKERLFMSTYNQNSKSAASMSIFLKEIYNDTKDVSAIFEEVKSLREAQIAAEQEPI